MGNFPEAVRIGDFNSDGLLDLAVANAKDNTISILLGNGDGTFTASGSPVPVGAFPFFLAVADFNGDGTADIAVSNENDSTVSILLGNGDGTFTQASGSPIPGFNYNPGQVVAADFNGDGVPDLAVANFTPSDPSHDQAMWSSCWATETAPLPLPPGSPITVGVVRPGPGSPQISTRMAIPTWRSTTMAMITSPTQTLTILLGNGNGTFTAAGTPTPAGKLSQRSGGGRLQRRWHHGPGDSRTLADFTTTILLNEFTQTATASLSNVTIAGTGTHYVDAVYGGNTFFATSTSTTIPLQGSTGPHHPDADGHSTEQMLTMPVTFTAQLASLSNEAPFGNPNRNGHLL